MTSHSLGRSCGHTSLDNKIKIDCVGIDRKALQIPTTYEKQYGENNRQKGT
jgi:hypothetical protein